MKKKTPNIEYELLLGGEKELPSPEESIDKIRAYASWKTSKRNSPSPAFFAQMRGCDRMHSSREWPTLPFSQVAICRTRTEG